MLAGLGFGCGERAISFADGEGKWTARPAPAWSRQSRLAISVELDDAVALVTPDEAPALLGRFAVGDDPVRVEAPHHLAAAPDGQTLYLNLSNYAPGTGTGPSGSVGLGDARGVLLKLRADDGARLGAATLDRNSGELVLSRDGATAYVSHYDLLKLQDALTHGRPASEAWSTVAIVDTATMAAPELLPVCPTAHGLALSSDERTLYVACSLSDELAIVDLPTRTISRRPVGPAAGALGAPNYFPYAVTRSPADGSIWIACSGGGAGGAAWAGMRVFDPARGAFDDARAVALNGVALYGDWLPDGKTLIVPHQGDEQLSFIDTAAGKEMHLLPLPPKACLRPHMVRVSPDPALGWLVCEGDHVGRRGTLVTLDLVGRAVLGSVEVGLYPDALVLLPPAR